MKEHHMAKFTLSRRSFSLGLGARSLAAASSALPVSAKTGVIDDQTKLFLFGVIPIKPEHFEEAQAALEQLIPLTLAEPGCHVFAAFASKDNSNTLHLFECFDDEDALNFHYAQDYTASVFKEYENWLSAPVEVTKMFATSPVSWKQFHD